MEEQRAAGGAERQVAEFIQNDQVTARKPLGDLARFSLRFLLLQGVDEVDRRVEADLLAAALDGLNAERGRDVSLPGSRRNRVILPGI
jgi:hypothetical protein